MSGKQGEVLLARWCGEPMGGKTFRIEKIKGASRICHPNHGSDHASRPEIIFNAGDWLTDEEAQRLTIYYEVTVVTRNQKY